MVSLSAWAADEASIETVDAEGKSTSVAYALDDVRCRFDGTKLSIVTGGEKSVQFLMAIADFKIFPTTQAWRGATLGPDSQAFFQDASGKRWKAADKSRCDISLERNEAQTLLNVKCTGLVENDTNGPDLQHLSATKLTCANAKLVAR